MQMIRVVLVSAAVAVLGAAAAVLGFLAERTNSKAFVGLYGQRCLYRRTAALGYGVGAALLALAGMALATRASGCVGRAAPPTGRSRCRTCAIRLFGVAWMVVVPAAVLFLYGAAVNRGGTRAPTAGRNWHYGGAYYYGCTVLKKGIFAMASILSAVGTACAIAGYVCFQQADEPAPGQFAAPAVGMGPPQWSQPYPPPAYPPPPPLACPAPSQYQHVGYGP